MSILTRAFAQRGESVGITQVSGNHAEGPLALKISQPTLNYTEREPSHQQGKARLQDKQPLTLRVTHTRNQDAPCKDASTHSSSNYALPDA